MKLLLPALAVLAATAALAPAAQAGPLVASAQCTPKPMSQVFLPWADPANYFLADRGDFESGTAGWTLGLDVDDVAGNERFLVTDAADGRSLSIGQGYKATSSVECVGISEPTLRFFAKGPALGGRLDVVVLFEDSLGNVQRVPAGSAVSNGTWQPTTVMPIVAALLPLLPSDTTPVRFEFKATSGDWQIDDVYVDPYQRR
jgi:hypothetical protein